MFIYWCCVCAHDNWYVDDQLYQTTTCTIGDDVTPPTAPTKYGYTFQGWRGSCTFFDYIESTGTQYINTGYIPTNATGIRIRFKTTRVTTNNPLFGSRTAYGIQGFSVWAYGGNCNFRLDIGNTDNCLGGIRADSMSTIQIYDNKVYLQDIIVRGFAPGAYSNYPIFIFNVNNAGTPVSTSSGYTSKIYEFKIYENANIVRDFVPAECRNAGIGMYDTITNTFFTNAGTGEFIAGPEI